MTSTELQAIEFQKKNVHNIEKAYHNKLIFRNLFTSNITKE